MRSIQKRGLQYSGIMHIVLIVLMIVGLPRFLLPEEIIEPTAITVDILPISALTNVRPSTEKKPAKEQPKPAPEKPKEIIERTLDPVKPKKEKPSPAVKTADETPAPPPEATTPDEQAVVKKEEKEKKPEKPKEEDPLDAILKSVKDTAATTPKEQQAPTETPAQPSQSSNRSRSNHFDPDSAEAVSIRDAIQGQIYKCWNVPAGARNAENLIVPLEIDYNKVGYPEKVKLADAEMGRYQSDSFYRAAVESAIRAVRACAPLEGLPQDRYDIWQYVNIRFNPREMLF